MKELPSSHNSSPTLSSLSRTYFFTLNLKSFSIVSSPNLSIVLSGGLKSRGTPIRAHWMACDSKLRKGGGISTKLSADTVSEFP